MVRASLGKLRSLPLGAVALALGGLGCSLFAAQLMVALAMAWAG